MLNSVKWREKVPRMNFNNQCLTKNEDEEDKEDDDENNNKNHDFE